MSPGTQFLVQVAAAAVCGWALGKLLVELLAPLHSRLVAVAAAAGRAVGKHLADRIERRGSA
jgi:hypothetical protein